MKATIAVFIAFLSATNAFAKITLTDPVSVENGELAAWMQTFENGPKSNSATGDTECREVEELKNAFLCLSYDQETMNSALTRASLSIEGIGGVEKGTVISLENNGYQYYKRRIGGHDLKGTDLAEFYSAIEKECTVDSQKCANEYEKEWYEQFILPTLDKSDGEIVIVTFAIQSSMSADAVVTHEILHAQYFLDEAFRNVIEDFWANELTGDQRDQVRATLGRHYNPADELLMRNEFQAYILMAGAEYKMLGRMVDMFRSPLMDALSRQGKSPLQVRF